jgi:hypothetical protein
MARKKVKKKKKCENPPTMDELKQLFSKGK